LFLKRTYPLVRVFAAESIYNKLLIGCFPWIDTSSRSQLELILSTTPWHGQRDSFLSGMNQIQTILDVKVVSAAKPTRDEGMVRQPHFGYGDLVGGETVW